MILDTTVEKKDEGILEVTTKIESSYINKVISEVANEIQAKAKLKGFRPGKAPIGMVKKVYEGELKYEALNKILPEIFEKVVQEKEIKPATTPEFKGYEGIQEGQDLEVSFVVETVPEVEEMGNLEEVKVKKLQYDYNVEETVEKELNMIRESQASYEDVEGAVKEGDFVKAEYKVIDETGTEGESRANFFVIKKEDPYYVLSQNFEGKEIGTNGDVEVDFPEDYPDKALAGQKKKVRFTIQEGKRVAYPELNDEFAKKLGNDSLDALKQGIEKNIKKKMEEQEILETADRIYDALIEKSKFSIAPSIILQQAQNDMTQQVNNLIRQGKTMEQYLQEEGLDQQQFVEKMKTDAVENIKKYLIVEKIAEANEVKIDDKAVDEFIEKMIELEATNQDQIRNYYKQNQQAKEGVKERLKFLKVAELVQEKAQISGTEKKKLGEE